MTRLPHPGGLGEEEVLAEIQKIAAARLGLERQIRPSDELIEDLGLESIDLITLAIELETHFNIALSPAESSRVRTVADLCRLVARERGAGD